MDPISTQPATGIVSDGEIAAPLRGVLARQDNVRTRLAEMGAGADADTAQ